MAERLLQLESEHYDINYTVRQKDFEINELTILVNDLRGKLYVDKSFSFKFKLSLKTACHLIFHE